MALVARVATLNLLNEPSRWGERRELVAEGLAALSLDAIALQEVVDPLSDRSTARWLAERLGGYAVLACPKSGRGRPHEGIAILSRWPVDEHATVDLGSQRRVAQVAKLRAGAGGLLVANGHFAIPMMLHRTRLRQVDRFLGWLRSRDDGLPAVICGDFNALPGSPAIEVMLRSYTSAHAARHGREPDWTCPTDLATGGPAYRAAKHAFLRAVSNRPGGTWRGTLDYIFLSRDIRVRDCDVILDRPSPRDPTLYASDHCGIAAVLEISPSAGQKQDAAASGGDSARVLQ